MSEQIGPFARVTWTTVKTGVPSTQGVFDESLLGMWAFAAPLREKFVDVLASGPTLKDSYPTVSGLAFLLNANMFYSDRVSGRGEVSVRQGRIPMQSPIVVSNRRVTWDGEKFDRANPMREDHLASFLARMQVDSKTLRIGEIPVIGVASRELPRDVSCEVLAHRVFNQRVELRVRVDGSCYARLAYAYSPSLTVRVNGKATETMETATRFLAVSLEAGEHTIVIEPELTPLRVAFLYFAIGTVIAHVLYLARRRICA